MTEQGRKPIKRTYQAGTLGLPPLTMVLVHAENDRANAAMKQPAGKPRYRRNRTQQEVVIRIIEHLTKVK